MTTTATTMSNLSTLNGLSSYRGPARVRCQAVTSGQHRPAAPIRLTRRGRVVIVIAFLAMLFAAAIGMGANSLATGGSGEPVPTQTVVVGSGDTLWGIASEVAEPGKTRSMMQRIAELNALATTTLQPGQKIAVPVG
ncbi:MAG: LysM peptidoglycan-binding domain-containing protein [Nocardioidaceae bacterium]|nr:MAG: LysM peptidoglycan-binding domain-containing protein [Nocardioidaceae bacterium]